MYTTTCTTTTHTPTSSANTSTRSTSTSSSNSGSRLYGGHRWERWLFSFDRLATACEYLFGVDRGLGVEVELRVRLHDGELQSLYAVAQVVYLRLQLGLLLCALAHCLCEGGTCVREGT